MFATYPSLADRVVLISGGGSGIGAELVRAFAANHARVGFLDIAEDASAALVDSLAGSRHRPVFVPCDVRDIAALQSAIDRLRRDLGPAAVLVNNAARDDRHELDDVTPAYWDENLAVNLKHFFFAIQAVRPQMRELGGGSIVNLSSIAWMRGAPRLSVYASAKAAIVGMTRSLAGELGTDRIRINCIAPGACVTERQLKLWYNETTLAGVIDRQCLKERLLPPDIARMALFLAADDSRMITKQTYVVDAGLL
ncbi:MAG TPA: SDR family oxidoreductase [Geminicoccaceae bacterium]|nr:SDR family oxidoreductase [Geminicoccus sp.]HMU51933.1 SDR family oxidoreductase [Geminicoccaceae bacterium]